jgi:hypothetical protein
MCVCAEEKNYEEREGLEFMLNMRYIKMLLFLLLLMLLCDRQRLQDASIQ